MYLKYTAFDFSRPQSGELLNLHSQSVLFVSLMWLLERVEILCKALEGVYAHMWLVCVRTPVN